MNIYKNAYNNIEEIDYFIYKYALLYLLKSA